MKHSNSKSLPAVDNSSNLNCLLRLLPRNRRHSAIRRGLLTIITIAYCLYGSVAAQQWQRHTIDDSSKGADGIRLGDINQDGLNDIVTGWEEGGITRVYINPGPQRVTELWPAVTVGKSPNVEDAVFVDVNADGVLDVVSCCEGSTQTIFAHVAPQPSELLEAELWKTITIEATEKVSRWMFCEPVTIDNDTFLIVGSKEPEGQIGYLKKTEQDVSQWKYQSLNQHGWIMSLQYAGLDDDGNPVIACTDRKGKNRGWFHLSYQHGDWTTTRDVDRTGLEYMFQHSLIDEGRWHLACATRNNEIILAKQNGPRITDLEKKKLPNPLGARFGKAVRIGDLNLDGALDLVHTSNTRTQPNVPGVAVVYSAFSDDPQVAAISRLEGKKFDRIEFLDLDHDGDLDVLTCEESDNLGVIWYENPAR